MWIDPDFVVALLNALFELQLDLGPTTADIREVHLVQGDNLRFLRQARVEQRQLAVDLVKIQQRVLGQTIQYVDQQARALNMAQEIMSQAHPEVSPFDQTGDIRQDQG